MKKTHSLIPIGIIAAALCALTYWKEQKDIETLMQTYRNESKEAAQLQAKNLENNLNQIYQGLRTMARLPGVKAIDRYAKEFSTDAHETMQEIYNNLATNVSMSEVYIAPVDLDPDLIDPVTGQSQAPITTFDELIISKNASEAKSEAAPEIPEIEIYEYRLMKAQMGYFSKHYATESTIDGLNYPAVSGPEVVTCDNSRYSTTNPNDKDRSGMVYSVPFYDPNGKLKGTLTGVVLTHALSDMITHQYYGIRNVENNFSVLPNNATPSDFSNDFFKAAKADPGKIYSEAVPLKIVDKTGQWILWASQPDSLFWERGDVKAAERFTMFSCLAIVLMAFAAGWVVWNKSKIRTQVEDVVKQLESIASQIQSGASSTSESSTNLSQSASTQASSLEQTAAAVEEISSMSSHNAGYTDDARKIAESMQASCQEGVVAVDQMITEMGRLKEASANTATVVQRIEEIAFQTNLLALNAAVEAARAGEAGKGFSVVAEEVRALAQRSSKAAGETKDMLDNAQELTDHGVKRSQEVQRALQTMLEGITKTANHVKQIADASNEQSKGIGEINDSINGIDQSTQQNATSANELADTAAQLNNQAEMLTSAVQKLITLFKASRQNKRAGLSAAGQAPNRAKKVVYAQVAGSSLTASASKSTLTKQPNSLPLA